MAAPTPLNVNTTTASATPNPPKFKTGGFVPKKTDSKGLKQVSDPDAFLFDIIGYEKLADVLQAAYDQAAIGKGAERHANGLPFHEQPMQSISHLVGSGDGLAFQAIKKLTEGMRFEEFDRFEKEALGAINYIAGLVIYKREKRNAAIKRDAATKAKLIAKK